MKMRTPRRHVRGLGSAKDGTEHFWRQRVTALGNVVLITFLVVLAVSLVGESYQGVTAVLSSPLVAVLMVLALVTVTYHMYLGMQVIIEDYVHGEGLKVLVLVGNIFFSGAVAVISIYAVLKLGFGG
jgi:succinate dehydrogenase / fumarate reductase membrane anchor subunit